MTNFESIYAALFALMEGIKSGGAPVFVTCERKIRHWNDVPAEQRPYLGQVQRSETVSQVRGLPSKWLLTGAFYIYVQTGAQMDQSISPSMLLNPLLGRVREVLDPSADADNVQTLGGLVSHAWLSSTIETSEGSLGDQEVAIVPYEILVP